LNNINTSLKKGVIHRPGWPSNSENPSTWWIPTFRTGNNHLLRHFLI